MALVPQYLPSGLDRADGLSGRPGTPDPTGAISTYVNPGALNSINPGGYLEEERDSPQIERGEQGTIRHTFKMDPTTASYFLATYGRGRYLLDSGGNLTRVVSASHEPMAGGLVRFSVVEESLSFDNPPDEFDVDIIELNPPLEYHPRYITVRQYNLQLLDPSTGILTPVDDMLPTGFEVMNDIRRAAAGNTFALKNKGQITGYSFNPSSPTTVTQSLIDLANELVYFYQKGTESFYLPGWRVEWSQFFYRPPDINPGGYIESPYPDLSKDPPQDGGLPSYFWSDIGDGSVDGIIPDPVLNNIFIIQAAIVNPAIYAYGISWLRECDRVQYQRTWFRKTATWVGGPLGHWARQLYDKNTLSLSVPSSQILL